MRIRIWGARASIPTPSTPDLCTSRFGGNTTCLSVSIPGMLVILDAGSGLRHLGLALDALRPVHASFFLTHLHWDHIQGFPYFRPLYRPGNRFDLYGSHQDGQSVVRRALTVQQEPLYFPVGLDQVPAELNFHEMPEGQAVELTGKTAKLRITPVALKHPGGCFGFRVDERSDTGVVSAVFATDTEPYEDGRLQLSETARGAALLIHDAQYTLDEYNGANGFSRKGWGHSTWEQALREAQTAGVKRLVLTHHDPLHDDWEIARMEGEAHAEGRRLGIDVEAAHEGMEIDL